ncbi:hypothetical protein BC828DRAFT_389385 [Blastocladiella britannica]|nr:hypothetical protein BC828DRAFT_389385 [Blastocladiella britannica]
MNTRELPIRIGSLTGEGGSWTSFDGIPNRVERFRHPRSLGCNQCRYSDFFCGKSNYIQQS